LSTNSAGGTIAWAGGYDLLVTLLTFGGERRFREKLLVPAKLRAGEAVLDIGCGTGTLALLAKKHVGASGSVLGIDAAPEMIARAHMKSRRKGVAAEFQVAAAQSLPFADKSFDVVLSTVMLHHLRRESREQALREARRVLKPGGRVVAVDFVKMPGKGLMAHFISHGQVDPRALVSLVETGGLTVVDSGPVGMWNLQFVVGRRELEA